MHWNHFSLARLPHLDLLRYTMCACIHKSWCIQHAWSISVYQMHTEDTWITNSMWYCIQNTHLLLRKHYTDQHQRVRYLKMECYEGVIFLHIVTRFYGLKWNTICVDIRNICMLSFDIIFNQRIASPPPNPNHTTTTITTATTMRKVYTNRYLFSFPLASISSIIKGSIIRKMLDDVEFRQYPALAAVTTSILLHH